MIVTMHAKCIHFAGHWTTGHPTTEPFWSNTYAQEWLCTWLLRSGMPLLSAVSGFLFSASGKLEGRGYRRKVTSRFWSLVVPFVFWSAGAALLQLGVQVAASKGPLYEVLPTAAQIFHDVFVVPVNLPTYFLRDLMLVILLSPLLSAALSRRFGGLLSLLVVGLTWWTYRPLVPNFNILFFFCVGGFLALHRRDPWLSAAAWVLSRPRPVFVLALSWLLLTLLGTWLQFRANGVVNAPLNNAAVLCGLLVLWLGFDAVRWPQRLLRVLGFASRYNFVLFAAHFPLMNLARKLVSRALPHSEPWGFLVFVLTSLIALCATLSLAVTFERFAPTLFSLATGGRAQRAKAREQEPAGATAAS